MAQPRRADEGEAGLIASQLAVVMPALLLLVMLTVQAGLWAHATHLAQAAADTAASTAALPDTTLQDARQTALGLLAQAGNLTDATVTVTLDQAQAAATVTGVTPQVVPGIRFAVTAQAAALREDVELMLVWPSDESIDFYRRLGFESPVDLLVWEA